MIRGSIARAVLAAAIAAAMAGTAPNGLAGSMGNGAAGGGFPQYRYEADANQLCKGDAVVWGSSANRGIYFVKGAGPYSPTGQRIGGFYACMADVKKHGYKIGE